MNEYFYILKSGCDSELYLPASQLSTHFRQHYTAPLHIEKDLCMGVVLNCSSLPSLFSSFVVLPSLHLVTFSMLFLLLVLTGCALY